MTPKTPTPVKPPTPTAKPRMRMRAFYCDDEGWDAAKARAKADGIDLAAVLRHYVHEYGGINHS